MLESISSVNDPPNLNLKVISIRFSSKDINKTTQFNFPNLLEKNWIIKLQMMFWTFEKW
jgi:hypothetical protein